MIICIVTNRHCSRVLETLLFILFPLAATELESAHSAFFRVRQPFFFTQASLAYTAKLRHTTRSTPRWWWVNEINSSNHPRAFLDPGTHTKLQLTCWMNRRTVQQGKCPHSSDAGRYIYTRRHRSSFSPRCPFLELRTSGPRPKSQILYLHNAIDQHYHKSVRIIPALRKLSEGGVET